MRDLCQNQRRIRVSGLVFSAFLFAAASVSLGVAREQVVAESAVKALLDSQVADWNRGDLDGFLKGYWRSPKVVFFSGGDRTEGWDAMRDRYRKRYQGTGQELGKLAFTDIEITSCSPEDAWVRGRWRLTLANGGKPGGLFTLIVRKYPEGWRIVHDHTSSEIAAKPEA